MTVEELALLGDSRLSREARIMGLHLSSLGEGEHEVPHEDFRRLLGRGAHGMAKDQTLAGYVQELMSYGWVERTSTGGRGSPRYVFTLPPGVGGENALPTPGSSALPGAVGRESVSPPLNGGQKPVVVEEVEVEVEEERGRGSGSYEISEAVETIVGEPSLEGCRGPLRDYLRTRTHPDGHHGYVRSIQAWLAGGSGSPRGLHKVDDPTHLIATALNDLLTEDERLMKSGRGQVGVIANLRTKVEILATAELRQAAPSNRSPARRSGALFPDAAPGASGGTA